MTKKVNDKTKTINPYKLELSVVLRAIDNQDLNFYSNLSSEEQKHYSPFLLLRYMSSLTDSTGMSQYAVLAVNDLVNIGFWSLSNHPDLQHKLLCLTGVGGKQFRPWISAKKQSKFGKVEKYIESLNPELNDIEIEMIRDTYNKESWSKLINQSGLPDKETKDLIDAWK